MKILPPIHVSPETAYLVQDYPYGFRLRCKIRYWLEISKTKGVRFCSQTTNPKRGDTWNKPKYSTYCKFGGAMFLNELNHVVWTGVHEYMDLQEMIKWNNVYSEGNVIKEITDKWIAAKTKYENLRAAQVPMHKAAIQSMQVLNA